MSRLSKKKKTEDLYVILSMAIQVQNQWFLPFQQYKFLREELIPIVPHVTRSNWPIRPNFVLHNHFVFEKEGVEYTVPEEAGVIVDFKVPEEWVDRHQIWYEAITDGITDYIKAAAKYLNIEVRFRPESSRWYRETYPKYVPPKDAKEGDRHIKETQNAPISKKGVQPI